MVIEIALGIVLAVIILALLPYIIGLGVVVVGIGLVILIIGATYAAITQKPEVLVAIAIIGGGLRRLLGNC